MHNNKRSGIWSIKKDLKRIIHSNSISNIATERRVYWNNDFLRRLHLNTSILNLDSTNMFLTFFTFDFYCTYCPTFTSPHVNITLLAAPVLNSYIFSFLFVALSYDYYTYICMGVLLLIFVYIIYVMFL